MPALVSTGGDAGAQHQVACYFPARFQDGVRSVASAALRRRRDRGAELTRAHRGCPVAGVGLWSICGLVGLAALSLAACGGAATRPSATPSPSQSALILVDGIPITQADVDAGAPQARLAGGTADAATAQEQAIERVLLRRQAERLGVSVAVGDLEARLAAISEGAGGEEALAKAVKAAGTTAGQLSEGDARRPFLGRPCKT